MVDKEQLWQEVYNIDGIAVADILRDFVDDSRVRVYATRYGEKVIIEAYRISGIWRWEFDSWSRFREWVSEYWEFVDIAEAEGFSEDDIRTMFVLKILRGLWLGELEDYEHITLKIPPKYSLIDNVLFM